MSCSATEGEGAENSGVKLSQEEVGMREERIFKDLTDNKLN